jgi:Flp pilus assembly protein TadD
MFRPSITFCLIAFSGLLCWGRAAGRAPSPRDSEITARIVLQDGSPIASSPMISLHVPGAEDVCRDEQFFMDGTIRLLVPPVFIRGERQVGCHITVRLSGYREFTGYVQDGTFITLHRIGPNEGSSISAGSLNAPPDAKKEYEAGEAAASKNKWPVAEEHFRAATALYPQYAMAWSELGQVLQEQKQWDAALEAFNKAHAIDPMYIKPIVQLAQVSSLQQHWQDERRFSDEALKLHPVEFPAAYYYHAEAAFHVGSLEDAEQFTREALKLDPGITCPESLVLLGAIFEKQGNPHDAAIEYKNYLKIAPHGAQSAEAKEGYARTKRAK